MNLNAEQVRVRDALRESVVSVLRCKEVIGRPYRFREARELLRQTDMASALRVMATLNAVAPRLQKIPSLRTKEGLRHLKGLYQFIIPKADQARVIKYTVDQLHLGFGRFYPLSPWACAAVTDSCLRFCSVNRGAIINSPGESRYFSRILLSFHSGLVSDRPYKEFPDFRALKEHEFSEFARNHLRANSKSISLWDWGRLHALFGSEEVSGIVAERLRTSPSSWFESHVGISIRDYRIMMFGLLAASMEFQLASPDWRKLTFDLDQLAGGLTDQARAAFSRLVRLAAIELPEIRAERPPNSWKTAVYGPNSLLRKQLLPVGSARYMILHEGYFVERYLRGIVHVVDDIAKARRSGPSWQKVRSDFGHFFEGYLRFWLKRYFRGACQFSVSIVEGTETDAVVVVGSTALVFEANHRPFSREATLDPTPSLLADMVESDLNRAISAARELSKNGLTVGGKLIRFRRIMPIAFIPQALPMSEITGPLFKAVLGARVANLDGDGGAICCAQILAQESIEYFDRVWRLPEENFALIEYLEKRSRILPSRFGPVEFDAQHMREKGIGNTWAELLELHKEEFNQFGPGYFRDSGKT